MPDTQWPLLQQFGIGTSVWHWLGRGFLVGLMVIAAANAVSYFCLSEGWPNLVGLHSEQEERIGFPFEVWQRGKFYGTNLINFPAFYQNGACGVVLGIILGAMAMRLTARLNCIAENVLRSDPAVQSIASPSEQEPTAKRPSNQFSVSGLMICTTIVAAVVGLATKIMPSPKVLIAIFFFAPVVMIAVAMLPRSWTWKFRVATLTVLAASSIGVAIAVGSGLGLKFDEVLMGIFICWTPQGVLGTLVLLAWLAVQGRVDTTPIDD